MARLTHTELALLCDRAYVELTGVSADLEYLVQPRDNTLYVAVRGTEVGLISDWGILDMIRNIRFLPWYTETTGWCHSGFLRGAIGLSRMLDRTLPRDYPLIMTGHSLGAAVAVLAAQLLVSNGRTVEEVVLFGCPRIYAFGYPTLPFPAASYRNGGDVICLMPRMYQHAVPQVVINPRKGIPRISDHKILRYADALKNIGL